MGGRGSKGSRGQSGEATQAAPKTQEQTRVVNPSEVRLYSKEQVDSLTQDYTPQMFLGNIESEWMGTGADLQFLAEENMPKELKLGGYTFKNQHSAGFRPQLDYQGNKTIVVLQYQSTEKLDLNILCFRSVSGSGKHPKAK